MDRELIKYLSRSYELWAVSRKSEDGSRETLGPDIDEGDRQEKAEDRRRKTEVEEF